MIHKKPEKGFALPNKYRSAVITALFLICGLSAFAQPTRPPMQDNGTYGFSFKRIAADTIFALPKDTSKIREILSLPNRFDVGALFYVQSDSSLHYWTGTRFLKVGAGGSGSGGGIDSVTSTKVGCVDSLKYWDEGVGTLITIIDHQNGLVPGTGLVTTVDSTTFFVDAAAFYLNCTRYTTGPDTLTLDSPGDTGRIDIIVLNTNETVSIIKGEEGEALIMPDYDMDSQFPVAWILVTDTGVTFTPLTQYWSPEGTNGLVANVPGKVRVPGTFQVGNYVSGSGLASKIHTDGAIQTGVGLVFDLPTNSGNPKNGIYRNGANRYDYYVGNTLAGSTTLVGSGTGSYWRFNGLFQPQTGTGEANNLELSSGVSPAVSTNTRQFNQLKISPVYNQQTFGSGILAGIYYNPTLTSLNGSTHYAWWSASGGMRAQNLGTSGDTTNYKPLGIDANGNFKPLTYWPGGGGGGGGTPTFQQTLTAGSTITADVNINDNSSGAHEFNVGTANPFAGINLMSSGSFNIDGSAITLSGTTSFNGPVQATSTNIDSVPSPQNMLWIDSDGFIHRAEVPTGGGTADSLTVNPEDFEIRDDSLHLKDTISVVSIRARNVISFGSTKDEAFDAQPGNSYRLVDIGIDQTITMPADPQEGDEYEFYNLNTATDPWKISNGPFYFIDGTSITNLVNQTVYLVRYVGGFYMIRNH